jgi:predicted ATPase/DNA-binding XRE family transcriptional regulator
MSTTDRRAVAEQPVGDAETFASALRRLRQAAGLTQEELAGRAGLTAKGVSALERGERRRPYPHTVRALAAALGLDDARRAVLQRLVPSAAPAPSPVAPAPPPGGGRPTGLPSPVTALIGRGAEAAQLLSLLHRDDVRLVTVTGPGGVGKTRLALHVAHRLAAGSDDVVFVALATVPDAGLVLPAVARALDLPAAGAAPLVDALAAHLGDRRVVLLLDNVEHVVAVAADLALLLGRCPGLRILATSRTALRVRGEHDYPLPPLALPEGPATAGGIVTAEAVELFVERARQAAPDFALTDANAPTVASLCRRLDGLPLALEIVAAQLRYADPTLLLDRVDRVLEAPGHHDLPARQRTMRATMRWSHDLLDAREQAVFRRLAVFVGGWTLPAAEAVTAGDPVGEAEILGTLGRLVEQSLVIVSRGGGGLRYRMLEPLRQYALERLDAAGEDAAVRERHARWFYRFTDRPGPGPVDAAAIARYDRLHHDHANVSAALTWLLTADPAAAARMCWSLWGVWLTRGHQVEGLRLASRSVERAPDDAAMARAAGAAGAMAFVTGDVARVDALMEPALAAARRAGDQWVETHILAGFGLRAMLVGTTDEAQRYLHAALDVAHRAGDLGHAAMVHSYVANLRLVQGDRPAAVTSLQAALDLATDISHRPGELHALLQLGQLAGQAGEPDLARDYLQRGAEAAAELREPVVIASFAESLAVVAVRDGQHGRAARLLGVARRLREEIGLELYMHMHEDTAAPQEAASLARNALGPGAYDAAVAAGAALPVADAIAEVLAVGSAPG